MGTGDQAELVVARRFRGPAQSGNGGFVAGLLAECVDVPSMGTESCATEVTLRRPPPLETPMSVRRLPADGEHGEGAELLLGADLVAQARTVDHAPDAVDTVDASLAAEAMAGYAGLRSHPFPGCFGCGPDREEGDGLRVFPGPVGEHLVASTWTPHQSLAVESDLIDGGVARVGLPTAWAAMDCVGGWSEDVEGRPVVLGRMTARVDALPAVGETHVVVGRRLGAEGRKTFTASTIYDSDGRVVARAEHVWFVVDPAAFN
ncbi:MAG TPA: hypothetical protein VFJ19_04205 [Nocardioidaceae bacterium]|nr:hypothetical protein [Nocardioidaceae bacterium]